MAPLQGGFFCIRSADQPTKRLGRTVEKLFNNMGKQQPNPGSKATPLSPQPVKKWKTGFLSTAADLSSPSKC